VYMCISLVIVVAIMMNVVAGRLYICTVCVVRMGALLFMKHPVKAIWKLIFAWRLSVYCWTVAPISKLLRI
jgi:hypothetical protein